MGEEVGLEVVPQRVVGGGEVDVAASGADRRERRAIIVNDVAFLGGQHPNQKSGRTCEQVLKSWSGVTQGPGFKMSALLAYMRSWRRHAPFLRRAMEEAALDLKV